MKYKTGASLNLLQKHKRINGRTNLRSLDLGQREDDYAQPLEGKPHRILDEKNVFHKETSTSNSSKKFQKFGAKSHSDIEKEKNKKNFSSLASTLQSTRYTSLNNSTSPTSELFSVEKRNLAIENLKNKEKILLSSSNK